MLSSASRESQSPTFSTMDDPALDTAQDDDTEDIAFAAEAAAQAVEAADAVSQQHQFHDSLAICRICGRGNEEGRPILRFLPVEHDISAASAAPGVTSFSEDIALHIFCGKTASILPSVNQPDLEILTKAGLKNKHGIGPEVNAALARTRCAILQQDGTKEKHYYLVREFEAHLAAIRHTHISFVSSEAPPQMPMMQPLDPFQHSEIMNHHMDHHQYHLQVQDSADTIQTDYSLEQLKPTPIKASAGQIHKPGRRQEDSMLHHHQQQQVTEDGKVRCGCGGTHWPTGTPRGAASWRSHVMTKRHQKWMEANGLMGTV